MKITLPSFEQFESFIMILVLIRKRQTTRLAGSAHL